MLYLLLFCYFAILLFCYSAILLFTATPLSVCCSAIHCYRYFILCYSLDYFATLLFCYSACYWPLLCYFAILPLTVTLLFSYFAILLLTATLLFCYSAILLLTATLLLCYSAILLLMNNHFEQLLNSWPVTDCVCGSRETSCSWCYYT